MTPVKRRLFPHLLLKSFFQRSHSPSLSLYRLLARRERFQQRSFGNRSFSVFFFFPLFEFFGQDKSPLKTNPSGDGVILPFWRDLRLNTSLPHPVKYPPQSYILGSLIWVATIYFLRPPVAVKYAGFYHFTLFVAFC